MGRRVKTETMEEDVKLTTNSVITTITYANLIAKISTSKLAQGQKYKITDFKTIYKQPVSNEILEGDIEPIVVTALSNNKLEPIAFSPSNPYDIVYYDVAKNNTAKYKWATATDKGQIYRRITKNKNDLPYDVRAIKFVYSGSNVYTFDDGNGNNQIDVVSVHDNKIGKYLYGDKHALNNSVFIGNDFQNNIIGNNFYNNIIDNNFSKNTIGNNFSNNTTGNNFNNNTIGNDFYRNKIGNGFYNNTIGNYFYGNTIDNDFNYNTISNNFFDNTISYNFYNNIIGNYFYNNTTYKGFNNNTISNYFHSNTIGNIFFDNTIGNDFYNNTIGDYFNNNTFGNCFQHNNLSSYATSDSNQFRYNEFGHGIRFSSVKDWSKSESARFLSDYTVKGFKNGSGITIMYFSANSGVVPEYSNF